ncbi:Acetolactate synthase large subunit IlvG [Caballeronia cordobensis]|uniref:Acetolactate synthase large subunit IlvG n=1 Tax=Caballeronia cordobensis TaxID=1353886 RepID=A0A158IEB4_CABCO|nr:thiamine pyrophosphate enzyme-like TPP binding region [Burkholderia sp. RPE67]SAL54915.1 Acetolactate synthase large subunit IlvG [Caballeronia cordobensis]
MSEVVGRRPEAAPATTTAEDTLKAKTRGAGVISGGHLVARALKNEGVDTIFTLCGGHIIDIYDGCVDEGIRIIDVRHDREDRQERGHQHLGRSDRLRARHDGADDVQINVNL